MIFFLNSLITVCLPVCVYALKKKNPYLVYEQGKLLSLKPKKLPFFLAQVSNSPHSIKFLSYQYINKVLYALYLLN